MVNRTECELHNIAVEGMNARSRYNLANYMAHGYEIESTCRVTVLKRDDHYLIIDNDGQIWTGRKGI